MPSSQIRFGISMLSAGNEINQEVCQIFMRAGVQALELDASRLRPEDNLTGFSIMLRMQKLFPHSIHARFGKEYDISQLDERGCRQAILAVLDAVNIAIGLDAAGIVVHPSAEPVLPTERAKRRQRCLMSLAEIGHAVAASGRRILLENLPRTNLGNDIDELEWFLDRLGDEAFGICLDVNHLMDRYSELPDIVRRLGPRLLEVHVSDYDGIDEKHWKPGKGVVDWPGLMQALDEINFNGLFTYECMGDGDNLEAQMADLAENFRWLSSLA